MTEENEIIIEDKEKKISWSELGSKLWTKKKFILVIVGIGLVIGLIIAFSIPKEYKTTIVFMPDVQSGNSSMSSLASMAGINLGAAGQDALASPQVYPDILNSTPFLKGLFNIRVKDAEKEIDTTLYSYLNDYQKTPWWSFILKIPTTLKKLFSSNKSGEDDNINERILSKEEINTIGILQSKIIILSDKKTSVTTLEVSMQSPEVSGFLADTLTGYFQSHIINYRTQKARNDLEYAEKLYKEARDNYYEAQRNLATYIDGNLNVVSAKYRTTQERLQNEASLSYAVYNQTAQQVQLAKIKVQDNTPVFTVIQPAVQPLYPSKPKKKVIVAGFLFLSVICAGVWVLRNDIWEMIS